MIKTIAIIGAGFAGLSAARYLKDFDFSITVFEKCEDVGGVWSASRRYPGLTTQNPRDTYALSDFPMPEDYPEWPSGLQVQEYMQAYANAYSINEHIRLNTEIVSAVFDDTRKAWVLQARTLNGEIQSYEFDYLLVANGIFSKPSIPDFEGAERFKSRGGRICHTSEFTDLSEAKGKHVLIVGYGKSSCDVANAIASEAASTRVIVRDLIWKIPKRLLNVLNYKYLFLTRLGEGLFRYIHLEGVDKFLHGAGRPIRNALLNTVEAIVARQCKLKALGLHPGKPLESIARSTVSLVTDGFYEKVASGAIVVHKQSEISSLAPGTATLSSGEKLPADIVVCGTGWQQLCPFFDSHLMDRIVDSEGNFQLYRSVLPPDVPRLAFNGFNSSFFSQLNAEIGALWLIDVLKGGLQLPSKDEQNRTIQERLAWMEERTDGKHSKGTNIIPFSVHHIDELLQDMRLSTASLIRFKQWLLPIAPKDYQRVLARLKERYREDAE